MEPTGEHFSPLKTSLFEIQVNLDRYLFAMEYLKDKVVIDIGCGAGLGTYLYSMVAKKIYAIDYDINAIEEAKKMPMVCPVEFIHADIQDTNFLIPFMENTPADVVVALEVLEHIDDPALVLKSLRAPKLVFSVPLHSMEVSTFHKFAIETEADVRKLVSPFYDIGKYEEQGHELISGKWIRGEGIRLIQ